MPMWRRLECSKRASLCELPQTWAVGSIDAQRSDFVWPRGGVESCVSHTGRPLTCRILELR
eukprot:3074240-Heterocapsa_arctica.AAC.1